MIEKAIAYKNNNKEFIISLKKLGLSEDEINFILKKYKRKKFEGGGDGGGGDGGGGDGGGDGGDGGDGSSDGSGGGVGGDDGAAASSAGDAGVGTGDSAGVGGSGDSAAGGVGSGPGGEADTSGVSAAQSEAQSVTADNISTQAQADQEDAATAAAANQTGIAGLADKALQAYMAFSPTIAIARAFADTISKITRGVVAPNDYSQVTESVQHNAPGPNNNGGINTINQFAPLYNTSTGDNTADTLRTRLNALIQTQQPVVRGIPSVSPYSNYTLLDLATKGLI
jgi:hypothetical protein